MKENGTRFVLPYAPSVDPRSIGSSNSWYCVHLLRTDKTGDDSGVVRSRPCVIHELFPRTPTYLDSVVTTSLGPTCLSIDPTITTRRFPSVGTWGRSSGRTGRGRVSRRIIHSAGVVLFGPPVVGHPRLPLHHLTPVVLHVRKVHDPSTPVTSVILPEVLWT